MAASEDEAPVEDGNYADDNEAPVEDYNYVVYDSADENAALNDRYDALPEDVELKSSDEENPYKVTSLDCSYLILNEKKLIV